MRRSAPEWKVLRGAAAQIAHGLARKNGSDGDKLVIRVNAVSNRDLGGVSNAVNSTAI